MTAPRRPAPATVHRPWHLPALLLAAGLAGYGVGSVQRAWQQPAPAVDAQPQVQALPRPEPLPPSAAPRAAPALPVPPRQAVFGRARPPADVRHVADWVVDAGDHQGRAFVLVDKRGARVWLFDPDGRLQASTPALVGAAVGDDPVPGIGDKPLSQVLPEEKTTPAGRYVAEHGVNASGEDVVWVSWDLAVSLHRVRPTVAAERRLERLASASAADNRISFGCINLPPAFYEQVLRPAVLAHGAVVYVLPETRTPQEQFGSWDVGARIRHASLATTARVK